jgi:hypothetical protein
MSDYADVVSYYDEELGVEVSYVTSHYDGYDSSTDRYVSVYDYTELKRDMEALRAELAALREDAAVGKAIENYVAGESGCNLIIRTDDEGTIEVLAMGFSSTEIHAQGDGKTLHAALAAAGLMEEEE